MVCCKVTSVMSDSVEPHRQQPTRLPCPWDSQGKNTGVYKKYIGNKCLQLDKLKFLNGSFYTLKFAKTINDIYMSMASQVA